jgi:hypothetical protein
MQDKENTSQKLPPWPGQLWDHNGLTFLSLWEEDCPPRKRKQTNKGRNEPTYLIYILEYTGVAEDKARDRSHGRVGSGVLTQGAQVAVPGERDAPLCGLWGRRGGRGGEDGGHVDPLLG